MGIGIWILLNSFVFLFCHPFKHESMTNNKALELQKKLTDKFLFSKAKVLALAGGDEGDDVTEQFSDIFNSIDGI